MTAAGFTISGEDHAISPVMLGDAKGVTTALNRFMHTIQYKLYSHTYLNI
jgi:hypothetical protein